MQTLTDRYQEAMVGQTEPRPSVPGFGPSAVNAANYLAARINEAKWWERIGTFGQEPQR